MFGSKRPFFKNQAGKFGLISLLMVLLTAYLHAAEPPALISVLDLESDGSVSKVTIDTISDRISGVLSSDKRYTVFDRNFLPFTLQSMGIKKQQPCSTLSCISGLGGRLGAKYVVGGSVHLKKKEVTITLLYVDAEKRVLLGTVTKRTVSDRNDFLSNSLPILVKNLVKSNAHPAVKERKKNFFAQPFVYVGGAAVAAAAAVVIYLRYAKGPGAPPGGNDLSLGDAPQHTR